MAWITPITDRTSGAYHTVTDQNRIVGNLDYVATELISQGRYSGSSVSKTTYTHNDYISVADWADIKSVLSAMNSALSITPIQPVDDSMTYENLNNLESQILELYNQL